MIEALLPILIVLPVLLQSGGSSHSGREPTAKELTEAARLHKAKWERIDRNCPPGYQWDENTMQYRSLGGVMSMEQAEALTR